jgi:hypothetical protein
MDAGGFIMARFIEEVTTAAKRTHPRNQKLHHPLCCNNTWV